MKLGKGSLLSELSTEFHGTYIMNCYHDLRITLNASDRLLKSELLVMGA